ncbi:hypothetical protein SAMN04488556_3003, partial [Halostagnicola kamekurae]
MSRCSRCLREDGPRSYMNREIPPMQPLAPIVDQMQEIAREELPEPRSCRIQLWDDGTFDVKIYHSPGPDSLQAIRYEPATSEIYWEYASGGGWEIT